jgi:transposase-like protein
MRPMKPYSEDLRVRIVSAVQEESMSKSAAARLFGVSLSSVKRYARMADRVPAALLARSKPYRRGLQQDEGHLLRKVGARSREALIEAMGKALDAITSWDAKGFFEHCGYRSPGQLL